MSCPTNLFSRQFSHACRVHLPKSKEEGDQWELPDIASITHIPHKGDATVKTGIVITVSAVTCLIRVRPRLPHYLYTHAGFKRDLADRSSTVPVLPSKTSLSLVSGARSLYALRFGLIIPRQGCYLFVWVADEVNHSSISTPYSIWSIKTP